MKSCCYVITQVLDLIYRQALDSLTERYNIRTRTALMAHLAKHNIKAVFHYLPLHLSSFAKSRKLGAWASNQKSRCPVAEEVSERVVRLPFYTDLTEADQHRVIKAIRDSS